jgi:hypothetical protein
MNRLPLMIPFIIILMIDVYIFRQLQDIKKDDYPCKCGQTTHVTNISNTIITLISISLIVLIIQLYLTGIDNKTILMAKISGLISLIAFGVQIYYLYIMISYLNKLKDSKCECVDQTLTNTMFYYAYTKIGIMAFSILFLIIIVVFIIPSMTKMAQIPSTTPSSLSLSKPLSIKKASKRS